MPGSEQENGRGHGGNRDLAPRPGGTALALVLLVLDDLRRALRGLARGKSVAAVLLISLGLGTGANVAVFRVAHGLLFSAPAGLTDVSSLVDVYTSRFDGSPYGPSSYPDFNSLTIADGPFEALAAIDDDTTADVSFEHLRQNVRIAAVSAGFFTMLKMDARRGRFFNAGDAAATLPGAVISSTLWEAFGTDEAIVGRTITVDGREHAVLGIAPDRFQGLRAGRATDVWVSLPPATVSRARGDRGLSVIARLKAAWRRADAQEHVRVVAEDLAARYPSTNRGALGNMGQPRMFTIADYSPLDPATRKHTAVVAGVIVGAAVLLLASACVNAGNLLLSRALARKREIAVKLALGATRRLLVRELMAEIFIISLGAAAVGLLLALWTMDAIPSLFAPEQAALLDTSLDLSSVAATVAVSVAAGLVFGLAPAVRATGESAVLALRGDSGEISDQHGGSRWRGILVVAQLAVSVVLILGATLLVSSLAGALEGDLGRTARRIVLFSVLGPPTWESRAAADRALQNVAGIEDVAWTTAPPLTRGAFSRFRVETGTNDVADAIDLNVSVVSPRYFQAMQLPVVAGREFDGRDGARAKPVVIIDEVLAHRYFGTHGVGGFLVDKTGVRLEIVGIVREGRYRTLQESPPPTVYFPITQVFEPRQAFIVVRTATDPASMLTALAGRLTTAGLTIGSPSTLHSRLSERFTLDRLVTTLVAVCGVIALSMAIIGVYGVINDTVRRRTREIGLRIALGAGRPQVARLVLAQAIYFTGIGMIVGIGAAALIARLVGMMAYDLPPIDAFTLTATPCVLALVVMVAGTLPVRRAIRVSPTIALRAE